MKKIIFLLLGVMMLMGCRTSQSIVKQSYIAHDTCYVDRLVFYEHNTQDTIIQKDSVYVEKEVKGDTVFIRSYNYSTKYAKSLESALNIAKKDSIVYKDRLVYKTITKTIIQKQSFWSAIKSKIEYLIGGMTLAVLFAVALRYRKSIWSWIKKLYLSFGIFI